MHHCHEFASTFLVSPVRFDEPVPWRMLILACPGECPGVVDLNGLW